MNIHDNSKGQKCDVCLKVFSNNYDLERHYRTHTGEKSFACKICDKKFSAKGDLVRHHAIHSGIKSFRCSICLEGRFFKTKVGLNKHMLFHYESKFSCTFCEHKSHTKSNLKTPEKTHFTI